jgi:hypothetical protein
MESNPGKENFFAVLLCRNRQATNEYPLWELMTNPKSVENPLSKEFKVKAKQIRHRIKIAKQTNPIWGVSKGTYTPAPAASTKTSMAKFAAADIMLGSISYNLVPVFSLISLAIERFFRKSKLPPSEMEIEALFI